ncbi:MAG: hypothetical protein MUC96_31545 [Myxococcaceae bacterium]|jgi:hypothetical protein|nr:hypothetical protein [Myxococcaceae bacterium]
MRSKLISSFLVVAFIGCGGVAPGEPDAGLEPRLTDAGDQDAGSVESDAGVLPTDGGVIDAGTPFVDAGDPCGPNGVFHINHCDCDPGFREVRLRCEAIPACMNDALEPNNGLATASRPDGGTASGQICAGDVDAFFINAPVGVRLEARLTFRHADGDLDLALYEPGRDPRFSNPVARGDSRDDDELISHQTRRAGDFLILVSGRFGTEQAPYHLQLTLTP